MIETEFRGKVIDKDVKGWIYGNLLRIPAPPVCIGKKNSDTYYIIFADPSYTPDWNMPYKMVQGKVIPETIGQYTGLKDKNGKKIYEGDIVDITRPCTWERGIIISKDGCYFVKVKETLLALYQCNINNFKLEVIGNITDNSELLERNN